MAEAPRNMQLPSGHDEEFLYAVEDDFICLICHLPLKEPVLTRCGHRFCNACLEEYLRRQEVQNQPYTCPADREGLDRDKDLFPDNATGRKILSLVIKCPSVGCSWTGELRSKEAHLKACPFETVICTNEHCLVTVKRKDLEQHVTNTCEWRIIECEYCEEPHPKRHLQDHLENCREIPLPCPVSCGNVIPRGMIPNHIDNDCPLSLVSCPYAQMGCTEKFHRKNLDSHLQSNVRDHLEFACVKLNSTQVQLNENRGLLDETRVQLVEAQARLSCLTVEDGRKKRFIWKIKSFSESLRQAKDGVKERIESDPFYNGHYGYKLKVFAYPYDTGFVFNPNGVRHLSIAVVLMEGEYDDILHWPFSKKVTVTIIDQNKDLKEKQNLIYYFKRPRKRELKDMIFSERPGEKMKVVESELPFSIPHEVLQTRRYIVNDTLFVQVDVGPDD